MSDLLLKLFHTAETVDASDIHLTQDEPAYLRVGGRLIAAKDRPLSDEQIRETLRHTINDRQLEHYEARRLDDSSREPITEHLAACPPCRRRLADVRARKQHLIWRFRT